MITLIFGAGASSGSVDCFPYKPPTGSELFEELIKLNGTFSKLNINQKKVFKKNFESGMALIENSSTIINPLQKEIATYLSKFEVGDNNTYVRLFRELKEVMDDITLVTLNYDLLIEQALIKNGLLVKYELNWNNGISLLKPHGSCNFLPILEDRKIQGNIFKGCGSFIDGLKVFKSMDKNYIKEWCNNLENSDLSPILSMYNKEKRVVINNLFIKKIQEMYETKIKSSSIIILMGIKFLEHDTHIWESIKNSKAQIYFNSRNGFDDNMNTWIKKHNINISPIIGGFDEKIDDIIKLILTQISCSNIVPK